MGRENYIVRLLKTEKLPDLEVLIVAFMNFIILWDVNARLAATDVSNILSVYISASNSLSSLLSEC
jgi:hypothetical protein